MTKNYDWMLKRRFTHRGLHNNRDLPENSLVAFENAIAHNYGIEFDVYLTNDNNLIVHHDLSLKRSCGLKTNSYKVDTNNLQNYKLFGTEHSIPLLKDMLELVNGQVPLILEIKTTNKVKSTCQAVYDMVSKYKGDICIESFDIRIVNWWAKNHPEYVLGQLYSNIFVGRFFQKLHKQYKKVDFLAVSCKHLPDKYFYKIKAECPEKLIINWTVRSPQDLENAKKYADNIIFECNDKNPANISLEDVNNY